MRTMEDPDATIANRPIDMMAGEDRCLPPWVLPKQGESLPQPGKPDTAPPAELTTTQSDSSPPFHHALL